MKRVLIATGGTGGHIFPALAVAGEIRARYPQCRILFMGGTYGPEGRLAREAGLEFKGLPVRGVLGRGMKGIFALLRLAWSLVPALVAVARFRPQVAAGFGSYASVPAIAAAWLLRSRVVLHEQNSVPGVSNRVLGRLAKKVLLAFPDVKKMFPQARTEVVGGPVRRDIAAVDTRPGSQGGRLLVLGGSLGARAVNDAVAAMLPRLLAEGIAVRHQCGQGDLERMRGVYADKGLGDSGLSAFIDDMSGAYAGADLVLARAGAATICELAATGRPSILVPFPYATHDHQTENARWLAEAGGAILQPQDTLDPDELAGTIVELMWDERRLSDMAAAARSKAMPDAAERIVDIMRDLAGETAPARDKESYTS